VKAIIEERGINFETSGLKYLTNEARVSIQLHAISKERESYAARDICFPDLEPILSFVRPSLVMYNEKLCVANGCSSDPWL
jgi:hypothetical protein